MTYLETLIQAYKDAIIDHYESYNDNDFHSFFASKYFDVDEVNSNLSGLYDLSERFLFLKFLKVELEREIADSISQEGIANLWLSKRDQNIWENLILPKEEFLKNQTERINYYNEAREELNSHLLFINKEIDELSFIMKHTPSKTEKASFTKVEKTIHKIEWKLKQTDLIEFFDVMKKHNLISENTYKNMNVVIRDCFTDENGNIFDNQNISKIKFNKGKESKNKFKIDQTIEDFQKNKPSK